MRTFLAILIGCGLVAASACAEDSIPEKTLADLKDATVFVKADVGEVEGTGSGFVVHAEKDVLYVVTNEHVIAPLKATHPEAEAEIALVFRSGTKAERSVKAEVAATDSVHDLAVLKTTGIDPAPRPVDLREKTEQISETMPVYIFGFPFGKALATGKRSPAITVARGSVSSLRRNDRDQVALVQIDGAINPGNSGGPVVDARGRLVGVAVARIHDAQIGLAIPCEVLSRALNGQLAQLTIKAQGMTKDGIEIRTAARVFDPLRRIKTVSVHLVPAGKVPQLPTRNADGTWPDLPDARRLDLELGDQVASAVFRVSNPKSEPVKYIFQITYVSGDGKLHRTNYFERTLDFASARETLSQATDEPQGGFAREATHKANEPQGGFKKAADESGREPKGGFTKDQSPAGGFARADAPRTTSTRQSLQGPTRKVDDLSVTELKLEAKSLETSMVWSADGQEFYLLESTGTLRRVALKDFEEQMRPETDHKTSWLSPSAEGLLLTVVDLQEAWLLDPTTLAVKHRMAVPTPTRVVSARGISAAFAASSERVLTVLDLKRGEQVRQYQPGDFSLRVLSGLRFFTITPDGKYLLAQGGLEQMLRFTVNGTEVAFDQASPRIAQNGQAVEVSADGFYAALPSGGGNYEARGHPQLGPYTTYVYKINDFTKPEIVVQQGAYPRALAFDLKAGYIYGQNHDHQLISFRPSGARNKEYTLGGGETREFSVHPDGGKLLVLTGERLYFVEFTGAK